MNTYLFDFDGTLVDSMPTYGQVMLRILDEKGVAYTPDILKIITPLGYRGTAQYYIGLGCTESEEALCERMGAYMYEQYAHHIPAKAHVPAVLQELKARGCSLNVLTASPHATLDPCLQRLGLWDLFDHVWSCEDFGTTKADPDIYRMAAERMGVAVGDVLFLDDNLSADRTAKAAGMQVCGVFDPTSAEYAEEMRAVCDRYITDFSELL